MTEEQKQQPSLNQWLRDQMRRRRDRDSDLAKRMGLVPPDPLQDPPPQEPRRGYALFAFRAQQPPDQRDPQEEESDDE